MVTVYLMIKSLNNKAFGTQIQEFILLPINIYPEQNSNGTTSFKCLVEDWKCIWNGQTELRSLLWYDPDSPK